MSLIQICTVVVWVVGLAGIAWLEWPLNGRQKVLLFLMAVVGLLLNFAGASA